MVILVVDDDDEHAKTLAKRLQADGHEVHLVSDELNARVVARTHKLDAAVVCMQRESGSTELARDLRANLLPRSSTMVGIHPADSEASDVEAFDVMLRSPLELSQLSGLLHHLCFLRRVPDSSNS